MSADPKEIDVSAEVIEAFDRIAAASEGDLDEILRAGGITTAAELLELLRETPLRDRHRLVDALLGEKISGTDSDELGYFRQEVEAAARYTETVGKLFGRLLDFSADLSEERRAEFVAALQGALSTAQYGAARSLMMALLRVCRLARLPRAYTAFFASALDTAEAPLASVFGPMARMRNRLAPGAKTTVLLHPKAGTKVATLEPIMASIREFVASQRVANDVDLVPHRLRGYGVSFWQSVEVWLPVGDIIEAPAPAVVFAMVRWVHQVHEDAPRRPISVMFINIEGTALAQIKWESGADAPTYQMLPPSPHIWRRPGLDE